MFTDTGSNYCWEVTRGLECSTFIVYAQAVACERTEMASKNREFRTGHRGGIRDYFVEPTGL